MQSYPKGSHDANVRSSRPRKRQFHGNRYTKETDESESASKRTPASTSARKLNSAKNDDIIFNPSHSYRIVQFIGIFGALADMLICKTCKGDIQFQETGVRGFGFKLVITCACGHREINSSPLINTGYEINRRIVFVMRLLGQSRQGINIFAGLMDIGVGMAINTYELIVRHIHAASSKIFHDVCQKAVSEEKALNTEKGLPETELKVSGDGSWKKRGFTSLYGVTTLIGYHSGKIVDCIVKSGYCQACIIWQKKKGTDEYTEWYETHQENCFANHSGSAGKMEVDAIIEMFTHSIQKHGVKYMNYIGDGDSKTYKTILDVKPYGDEYPVVKSECIGHVEKRMGTRLRNVKKEKKLGGRGKLTDVLINKLTKYYGLAIRRNVTSVEDMKKAIYATLDHLSSTDDKLMHDNCPAGADSWCKWRKAEAAGTLMEFHHSPPLHPDVLKNIRPIYDDLSKNDLLTRCLGGHTQNPNESFNSTVWRLAPKHLHAGSKIVEIATFVAACIFNEGYNSVLLIMSNLELCLGIQTQNFAATYDEQRLLRQRRRTLSSSKEARMARRQEQIAANDFFEEQEGLLYGAGIAD